MAAINGTTIILDLDGSPLALETETTLNIEQALPDSSSKDSAGWADHINGQRSWSIDLNGRADFGNNDNVETLAALIIDRAQATIEWSSSTSGDVKFTGTVSLANLTLGAPNEDVASLTGTLTGKGELTKTSVS